MKTSNLLLEFISVLLVISVGSFFRLQGVNWDQNQHLNPDERFIVMTEEKLKWPKDLMEYFDPNKTRLSPYNTGTEFFVYGTLPLTITKAADRLIKLDNWDLNNLTLLGRIINALIDLISIFLIFIICRRLVNGSLSILGPIIYATNVLAIQMSHFATTDIMVNFGLLLSLLFLTGEGIGMLHIIGIALGLSVAISSKISVIYFIPLAVGFVLLNPKLKIAHNRIINFFMSIFLLVVITYFLVRLFAPPIFENANLLNPQLNSKFVESIRTLNKYNNKETAESFPPAVQWLLTKRPVDPIRNLAIYGIGVPVSMSYILLLIFFISRKVVHILQSKIHNKNIFETWEEKSGFMITLWSISFVLFMSYTFNPTLRYFLLGMPMFAISLTFLVSEVFKVLPKRTVTPAIVAIILLTLIWPTTFSSVYSKEHTRVTASKWIYENIPYNSSLSTLSWDDTLPLNIGPNSSSSYRIEEINFWGKDTDVKWAEINNKLNNIEYLVLSSNRIYGSVGKLPEMYPKTSQFFLDLFSGNSDYIKVAEFTSYPQINILGTDFVFNDDASEEEFTVFDHPKVLIFRKTHN